MNTLQPSHVRTTPPRRPIVSQMVALALLFFVRAGMAQVGTATGSVNVVATAQLAAVAKPAEGGSVIGGGSFPVGTTQVIAAVPAAGYVFAGWGDGSTEMKRTVLVPTAGASYVANFVPGSSTLSLSVSADPATGGTVGRDPDKTSYALQEKVTLTARPSTGFAFVAWKEISPLASATTSPNTSAVNVPPLVSTANPFVVPMTRSISLVAQFARLVEGAEIDVQGRGVTIASGDTTPAAADDTEFGTVLVGGTPTTLPPVPVVDPNTTTAAGTVNTTAPILTATVRHTFTIRNAGNAELKLTGTPIVAKSGEHAADFTVTQPSVTTLPSGRAVTFDVIFAPSATGNRVATLSIANNDSNENPYTFTVHGTGVAAPAPYLPTAQQTSVTPIAAIGEFRANVSIVFPNPGYGVDWGQAVVAGNKITLNARAFAPSAGMVSAQVITTQSFSYPLGPLPAGTYEIVFKVADQTVKTAPFSIYSLTAVVAPAGTGRVDLSPLPVGDRNYLAGTTVSLLASPLPKIPLPMSATGTPDPAVDTTLVAAILPAPIPGNIFQNWTGDATGTTNPISVKVDANKTVTANFTTPPALPTVTTGAVTAVTTTGAKIEGNVTSIGGAPVTERGFLLFAPSSATPMPTTTTAGGTNPTTGTVTTMPVVPSLKFPEGSGAGAFSHLFTGLLPATTYYVSAYASNAGGTAVGPQRAFSTLAVSNTNTPPTISVIPGQVIAAGARTPALPFTVNDTETAADRLVVSATSSNPDLIPASGIVLGGSGANRTITVTPGANLTGTAVITLTATDEGRLAAKTTFNVTVTSPTPVLSATLSPDVGQYLATGGSVTFTAKLNYAGTMSAIGFAVGNVPAGWSYAGTGGTNVPSVTPAAGDSAHFDFAYTTAPASPAQFTFTVKYPAGLSGNQVFAGIVAMFRPGNDTAQTVPVPPITLVRAASGVPVITAAPPSRAVRLGGTTALTVTAEGAAPLTYQWKKDGVALTAGTRFAEVTGRTLTIANAQFTDAGAYTVVVSNAGGSVTSAPEAMLSVVDAQHAVAVANPAVSGVVTVKNTLTYAGAPAALGWQVVLPDGWSYVSGSGTEGEIKPAAGASGLAEWAWTAIPSSPLTFTYTLKAPPSLTGEKALRAMVLFRQAIGLSNILVVPDPLLTPTAPILHSADTDGDSRISLVELTRVLELYNTRNGTVRTGSYTVAAAKSEDGFAPEPERPSALASSLPLFYSADTNHDGKLSLSELTRVLELYNTRSGSVRTGAYRAQAGTEDGFSPAP